MIEDKGVILSVGQELRTNRSQTLRIGLLEQHLRGFSVQESRRPSRLGGLMESPLSGPIYGVHLSFLLSCSISNHCPKKSWGGGAPATREPHEAVINLSGRSTKAEASAPATPFMSCEYPNQLGALNEGRGISPGDTRKPAAKRDLRFHAQRRPRHQPRRHRAS